MQSEEVSGADEEAKKMDYDELTLNPSIADIEAEPSDTKGKRRYWSQKEEDKFFEIWGRDNWCLTKNGRNTIYFAKWAKEMKERFEIDVKPEEVQAKVNQTRAKFRSVKKQYDSDKTPTRWKKFNIIDLILRNKYRPVDAEPVPPDALENNRDMSTEELSAPPRQPTPTSTTSNSTQDAAILQDGENVGVCANSTNDAQIKLEQLNDPLIPGQLYTPTSDTSRISYGSELFSDPIDDTKRDYDDEIKREEFENDYRNSYQQYQPEQNLYAPEQPQLHQLQTPQQQQFLQQQQQQIQQQQYQSPQTATIGTHPQEHLQQHIQQLQQQQQQQLPTTNSFDVTSNAYVATTNHINAAGTPADNHAVILNNVNQFVETPVAVAQTQPQQQQFYSTNFTQNHNTTNTNSAMQPPGRNVTQAPNPRKRRNTTSINIMSSPAVAGTDTFESQYLEEVRKKNLILAEQKDIGAKRLLLEQRKVDLLENFFPQCLALQEEILQKLNNN